MVDLRCLPRTPTCLQQFHDAHTTSSMSFSRAAVAKAVNMSKRCLPSVDIDLDLAACRNLYRSRRVRGQQIRYQPWTWHLRCLAPPLRFAIMFDPSCCRMLGEKLSRLSDWFHASLRQGKKKSVVTILGKFSHPLLHHRSDFILGHVYVVIPFLVTLQILRRHTCFASQRKQNYDNILRKESDLAIVHGDMPPFVDKFAPELVHLRLRRLQRASCE